MRKLSVRASLLFAAFALFVVPVIAYAAAGFVDVADDNVFVADIQWMKDNGITKGCNPPTNNKFCPDKPVTRQQMSAFMHRLATKKVVAAATAESADDADMLDGK
ncbi:MAG: S-layer homology domain-containing protein, partial [Actinomycetota bacterium]